MLNQASVPTAIQKRAADLAVARFGVERSRVEMALQRVLESHARGNPADLLDALATQGILTLSQAHVLRLELEEAYPETAKQAGNGTSAPGEPAPTSSGHYLRKIGPYRLLRRLGQGGMGSVYLAYQEGQKHQVAIKVLSDQLASNDDYVERFYREARSGALLNHPNIVRCIDVGHDDDSGKHYLVLEFVAGLSAQKLLERMGPLPVGDAVYLTLDIARALEHAHSRSIVHRDIKPDNILLTLSGVAKLTDLGLAKRMDESSNLTALRQGFGTLHYIPCEQAFNAKQADGRSDIYALGATLYHLLTGEVPFAGQTPVEIADKKMKGTFPPARTFNPQVPEVLDAILARMMARLPQDRYQLVSELIVDLERSGLAASIPSFADPKLAQADPVVQSHRTAQPTRLDVDGQLNPTSVQPLVADTWYLRYRNSDGRWRKTKMTTEAIRERIADGRIPAGSELSQTRNGEFRPASAYPEFRALKAGLPKAAALKNGAESGRAPTPAPESAADSTTSSLSNRRLWHWLAGAASGLLAALIVIGYWFFIRR
jgi:serine/threonine-protein kinase